ncbi:hypothetical protein PHBOTO_004856 [Pseudozyma hubeiensis]|nr:hypothetical protein PHBOTO_004856 [Pseudozyma hubeiensis]
MESSSQLSDRPGVDSTPTFNPNAVAPAFARPPTSTNAFASSSSQPASQASAPSQPSRHIPALGDASLMNELPTTDPLSTLLQKHLPPHIRPLRDLSGAWHASSSSSSTTNEIPDPFTTNDSTSPINAETVRQATASNSWRKIASLARERIEEYGRQTKYPQQTQLIEQQLEEETMRLEEVLEWWTVRVYSLARLRLYAMLRSELDGLWSILEREEVLEMEGGVPFTLRVLRAMEPKWRGDVRSTVEQYTVLIRSCKDQMRKSKGQREEVKVWKTRAVRLGLMLSFALAEVKDFSGAIEVLHPLIETSLRSKPDETEAEVTERLHLVIVASRIYIQAGDLFSTTSLLNRTSPLLPPSSPLDQLITQTHSIISTISSSPSPPDPEPDTTSPTSHLNQAISTFYSANLDLAISQLESVLHTHPALAATADALVFNLATLYELDKGGDAHVLERKRGLLRDVARWAGEPGVGGSCFKL